MTPAQLLAYQQNVSSSAIEQVMMKGPNPEKAWALPYVTGHKYRFFWDISQ
jgi:hypothetical protein